MTKSFENTKVFEFISEYCTSSTLHGVKYIGEPKRPIWERIFWISILFLSLYGSTKFTLQLWEKWQNHPVIISLTDKTTPIGKIPFPAITICPTNSIKTSILNLNKYMEKADQENSSFSQEELKTLEAISVLCQLSEFNKEFNESRSSEKIQPILDRIRPKLNENFLNCIWKGRSHPCQSLWTETLTVYGICYTFNLLGSEHLLRNETIHGDFMAPTLNLSVNWDSESGYTSKDINEMRYPRRVLNAGFEIGMTIDLIGRSEDTILQCEGYSPGFFLFLHAPNDYPDGEKDYIRLTFGQEFLIAVEPNMKITSSKLLHYSPERRQCYFPQERYLRYFKIYTRNNCEIECLGNYTLEMCQCIPFYLPRSADTPVCRVKDKKCFENASEEMMLNEGEENSGICKCLPGCTALSYGMKVSYSDIYLSKNDTNLMGNNTLWDRKTEAIIFFKEDQFWMSKRSETYGVTEFIGNCGGILGLLMGFSILSLMEIIYFLTFRLIRFVRQQ